MGTALKILFLWAFLPRLQAQERFDLITAEATGELSGDKRTDKVIVLQDTLNAYEPYRFEVLLTLPDGSLSPVLISDSVLHPAYPQGRNERITGSVFSGVVVRHGMLILNHELLRGHIEQRFRLHRGDFELVYFSKDETDDQGNRQHIEFDLLKGRRIMTEYKSNGKRRSRKKERSTILPLPILQHLAYLKEFN